MYAQTLCLPLRREGDHAVVEGEINMPKDMPVERIESLIE
jgi:hypothetical protein